MNAITPTRPGLLLRILQFPATRLIALGSIMFVMLVLSNDLQIMFAGSPLKAAAAVLAWGALAMGVYIGYARVVERRQAGELALPGMGRQFGIGLLFGAGLYTLCVLVLMVAGIYRIDGLNPLHFMLAALPMALSSGIFEELFFRGVLFRSLEDLFGSWAALAVSSLVFGFVHLLNPQGTLEGAIFISVEAGLLLAAAYMVTGRLWTSIGFHMAWNYTQSAVFSGIVSGSDTAPGLVKATIEGPDLLTGGSFGLESSLVAFVLCTTTGVVMLVMAVRRGRIRPPMWKRKD
jgi:membrane protease YdiL (CAAX protease family)